MLFSRSSSLILLATAGVHAWGKIGHQLTGAVASKFLSATVRQALVDLLPDDQGSLSEVATWADEVKRDANYRWSSELHYIDAKDAPPSGCGVDYDRDCPEGNCVVGAIANYTTRLAACSNEAAVRTEAAKFITHFAGDITQPLHTCARDRGGNNDKIHFGKKSTNLHSIWDTNMVEKRMKDFGSNFNRYLDYLVNKALQVHDDKNTQCLESVDFSNKEAVKDCVLLWAVDSDSLNCQVVWGAYENDPDQDFSLDYYNAVLPTLENQIIKAGLRMAKLFTNVLSKCNTAKQ